MKTFSFNELTQEAQDQAVGLYYADPDIQAHMGRVEAEHPEEVALVSDCAEALGWRFDESGSRAS